MQRSLFRAVLIHKKSGLIKAKHFAGEDIAEALKKAKHILISYYCISFVMTDYSAKKVVQNFIVKKDIDCGAMPPSLVL
jgi:hypothetical protein